jgi:autotransporter strand-loop-strand O-heptosyltransferase
MTIQETMRDTPILLVNHHAFLPGAAEATPSKIGLATRQAVPSAKAPAVEPTAAPSDATSEASAAAPDGAPPPASKRAYPAPAEVPTQQGAKGLRFDFNDGCRVLLPESDHPWRVRLSDLDTGNILFETELKAGHVNSTKRYYLRPRVEAWQAGERVFVHDYSAADREVLIQFPVGTLGDPLGWFPYAVKFKEQHRCRLTCAMGEKVIELLRGAYPDITFLTHEEIKTERYYATYSIGLFFDDKDFIFQPTDFRHVGLHRTAAYILGVDPTEERPRIALPDDTRPIAAPYVVIAAQSTTQCKFWNNPNGWREIVAFLKAVGYRVICIDQKPTHGTASSGTTSPMEPRTRPGTSRSPNARVISSTPTSSSAYRAVCPGSPGRWTRRW